MKSLLKEGCEIRAYDPAASERAREVLPAHRSAITIPPMLRRKVPTPCLILTDWSGFANLDLERLRSMLAYPIVVDGRNLYDPATMSAHGFLYYSIGRPDAQPTRQEKNIVSSRCMSESQSIRCGRVRTSQSPILAFRAESRNKRQPHPSRSMLKIFSDRAYVPPDVEHLWQLSPFWGLNDLEHKSVQPKRLARYLKEGSSIFEMTSLESADFAGLSGGIPAMQQSRAAASLI